MKKTENVLEASIRMDEWLSIKPKNELAFYAISQWLKQNNTNKDIKIVIEKPEVKISLDKL